MKRYREYFDSIWHYSLQGKMATASFIMGCVIAVMCLFCYEPLGEIATSAISIVSMFLVLAGALVGVKVSFDHQSQKFAAEIERIARQREQPPHPTDAGPEARGNTE